jgi:diaminopimelate epimerase
MGLKFVKMQGIGNDYVYLNGFQATIEHPEELAIQLSNRHFGIGSDGLVLILPSGSCDFRMRMFNSDGSESPMCGNAVRCIGKFVYESGLTAKTELTLETLAGVKKLRLFPEDGKVRKVTVDMGEPILSPQDIPVNLSMDPVVNYDAKFPSGTYPITCVSMGNPHAVIFTGGIDQLPLSVIGPEIETDPLFPLKTNVEFVEVVSPDHVRMRVWERGTGETMACGTGACAVLVAGVLNGLLERKATVSLPGGDLQIEWNAADNRVYMTGPAVNVFEGELILQ